MGFPLPYRASAALTFVGFIFTLAIAPRDSIAGVTLNPGDVVIADQMSQGSSTADGRLIRVDPATGQQTLITSGGLLADPNKVVRDSAGNLLVADFNSGGSGAIIKVDPVTGVQTSMTPS